MKTKKENWCIVGNGSYGLWYGIIRATDAQIIKNKAVRIYRARNIRYWYGKKGGISSLAAFGPCGPRQQESRIGAEIVSTLVLDVKAVHCCSPEAVVNFASVKFHE